MNVAIPRYPASMPFKIYCNKACSQIGITAQASLSAIDFIFKQYSFILKESLLKTFISYLS